MGFFLSPPPVLEVRAPRQHLPPCAPHIHTPPSSLKLFVAKFTFVKFRDVFRPPFAPSATPLVGQTVPSEPSFFPPSSGGAGVPPAFSKPAPSPSTPRPLPSHIILQRPHSSSRPLPLLPFPRLSPIPPYPNHPTNLTLRPFPSATSAPHSPSSHTSPLPPMGFHHNTNTTNAIMAMTTNPILTAVHRPLGFSTPAAPVAFGGRGGEGKCMPPGTMALKSSKGRL